MYFITASWEANPLAPSTLPPLSLLSILGRSGYLPTESAYLEGRKIDSKHTPTQAHRSAKTQVCCVKTPPSAPALPRNTFTDLSWTAYVWTQRPGTAPHGCLKFQCFSHFCYNIWEVRRDELIKCQRVSIGSVIILKLRGRFKKSSVIWTFPQDWRQSNRQEAVSVMVIITTKL